jgi:hypothetical protein
MNCPHCQKTLPENYSASYCPHCGKAVRPAVPVAGDPPLTPIKIHWLIFFVALLGPSVLTMLVAFLTREHSGGDAPVATAFIVGGLGGIASGVMLALRLGSTIGLRILLGLVFSGVLAVVCITLSCVGCLTGGYQLNLH